MRTIRYRIWSNKTKRYIPMHEMNISKNLSVVVSMNLEQFFHQVQVDDDCVIEEYLDLVDKNGVDTYEGDIIKEWIVTVGIDRKRGYIYSRIIYEYGVFIKETFEIDSELGGVFGLNKIMPRNIIRKGDKFEIIGNVHTELERQTK